MSDKKWTLLFEILAGNQSLVRAMSSSQSSIKKFVNQARTDFQSISRAWNSTTGRLASLGLGVGAVKLLSDSAKLERSLTRVALSAGRTKEDARGMKEELESLGVKTGQSTEVLEQAFASIYKLSGSWDAAKESISSINAVVAVTGASADQLGGSLAVAADAFNIDLTKPQAASDLLNKMAALGKGAGGLSNIADIFNQIALPASMTGMNADSALQFIGMLSQVTKNPAQMGALADNTLRMFTNLRVLGRMKGVKLFDDQGNRRSPLLVLQDIQKQYEKLDAKAQSKFLMKLLNGGDPRAMRSLAFLFESGAVNSLDKLKSTLDSSGGRIEEKLPEAINNAADQAARLKNLLGRAADSFANPINKAVADLVQYGMDKKGLSGGDIAGLGTAAILAGWVGKRVIGRKLGKLFGGGLGTVGGIAEGEALRNMGIQPVFVVNASEIGGALTGNSTNAIPPGALLINKSLVMGLLPSLMASIGPMILMMVVAYFVNKKNLENRLAENEYNDRTSDNLVNAKTGEIYRKKLLKGEEQYNLFNDPAVEERTKSAEAILRTYKSGDGLSRQDADTMRKLGIEFKQEAPTVNVYIDGKKETTRRVITFSRGKFETQDVSDVR